MKITANELGIKSATDDARLLISNALPWIQSNGGAEIIFESGQDVGWSNILHLPDNTHLTALGNVGVFMLGDEVFSRFVRTTSGATCEINGPFVWDAQARVTQIFIEARDDARLTVDGSTFISTGADLTTQGPTGVRIGTGANCIINNVSGNGIGNLVHWAGSSTAGPSFGRQTHTRLDNPAMTAGVSLINHHTTDLTIHDIEQTPYAKNVIGGHCISLQGESIKNPKPTITGLKIDRIRLTGREGVGWEPGNPNGATGDMIAIRSADEWSITDFELQHGGEFGISVVHGSQNGYIGPGKGLAKIEHMDGSAIVLGSSATRDDGHGGKLLTQPARNVLVEDVELHNIGVDNARTPLGFSSISGIRVLNAVDCEPFLSCLEV